MPDGAIDPRLSEFLTRCLDEEPEIEIRLPEVPFSEQRKDSVKLIHGQADKSFTLGDIRWKRHNIVKDT